MKKLEEVTRETHKPRWYDYTALPGMLVLCLIIVVIAMGLVSQRAISPFELSDDPKMSHIRLYQDDVLLGMITSENIGNPSAAPNLTIVSKENLELWFFQSYLSGYSNKYESTSQYSLKYSTDGENYTLMIDKNEDPIHPVKANDGEVMGYFFDLSLFVKSGYIENWTDGTSIYLTLVKKISGWTYRITNPTMPVQILYKPS